MKRITAALMLVMLLTAHAALAQCKRTLPIKFERGRTGAVLKGNLGTAKSACYKLHARSGQRMTAHLTSSNKRARFSIGPDFYDADFLEGAYDVTDWEGELSDVSGGNNFLIIVSSQKAGETYTLEINIR
ncbi:MAG: hypothetical protein WBP93_12745 [Pyrinomonadaceae bacterium]